MLQLLQQHTGKMGAYVCGKMVKGRCRAGRWKHNARAKGTPRGGVISPLLANIYLHHAFDMWMNKENTQCPFERYADDIVLHCSSKEEAEQMLEELKNKNGSRRINTAS